MDESGIGIQPIHIRYLLNADTYTNQVLTRSTISQVTDDSQSQEVSQSQETEQYPFFTDKSRIPLARLLRLPQNEQFEVFFNKKKFQSMMMNAHKSSNLDDRNKNAEYNIRVLLNILLPTSFPVKNNLHDTFNENIKGMNSVSVNTDKSFLSKLFSKEKNKFAYINSSTVMSITWVNDIINDPLFNRFITSAHQFLKWIHEKKKELTEKAIATKNEITSEIKAHFKVIIDTLNDRSSNAYIDYSNIVLNERSAANRANVRSILMDPYFTELKRTNITNIDTIIKMFVELHNLSILSNAPNYIPVTISGLEGFKSIMKKSVRYVILNNILSHITNLNLFMNQLKLSKDDIKRLSNTEEQTLTEVKKFTHLTEFIGIYKKLQPPYRQYTNMKLTKLFKDSSNNLDDMFDFVTFINGISDEDNAPGDKYYTNTEMIERLKTGVMSVVDTKDTQKETDVLMINVDKYYDVCVHIDTVTGKLTDENIEDIKCPYQNERLNRQYAQLQSSDKKNPVLLYRETNNFEMGKGKNHTKRSTSRVGGRKKNKTIRRVRGGFPKKRPHMKIRLTGNKSIKSV